MGKKKKSKPLRFLTKTELHELANNSQDLSQNDESNTTSSVSEDTDIEGKNPTQSSAPHEKIQELNLQAKEADQVTKEKEQNSGIHQHSNNHGQAMVTSNSNLVFVEDLPLTRAPSPFLSESHYLQCHQAWQAERKSNFEKSQVKLLTASNKRKFDTPDDSLVPKVSKRTKYHQNYKKNISGMYAYIKPGILI